MTDQLNNRQIKVTTIIQDEPGKPILCKVECMKFKEYLSSLKKDSPESWIHFCTC